MELRQCKAFVAVARLGNFRKAAEVLHYAQSSVSAQIKGLEDAMGVRLFDRLDAGVRLTAAGERLLPYALNMLSLAEEAGHAVGGEEATAGTIVIRMPEVLAAWRLPALLPQLEAQHPGISLRVHHAAMHSMAANLEKGLDLAFTLHGHFAAPGILVEKLGEEALVFVTNPGHPLANAVDVTPEQLAGERLLTAGSDAAGSTLCSSWLGAHGQAPPRTLMLSSVTACVHCLAPPPAVAKEGIHGIALLPLVAVEDALTEGRLARVGVPGLPPSIPRLMLRHSKRWLSPAVEAFVHLARQAWG